MGGASVENILVGSAKLLLVSQLFIVDAGVALELLFSVFVGQCACLYVRDDFFRFCTSARKLSLSTLLCRRNDGAKNKKMQSIHQCMAIVTNEEQHHLHYYFRTSAIVQSSWRIKHVCLLVCTTNEISSCGLEEKKERLVVKCKCISLYQLHYCIIAYVLDSIRPYCID